MATYYSGNSSEKKKYFTNLSTGEAGAESEIIRCVILDSLNKLQKKVIPAKI